MSEGLKVEFNVRFDRGRAGRKTLEAGPSPVEPPVGGIPRVARLMALAIRFEGLIRRGEVRDYAELARLGHVTRARLSQICALNNLAPDIQAELLGLAVSIVGEKLIQERALRPIAAESSWRTQRRMWARVRRAAVPQR
jgi:hypothetical protein